MTVQSRAEPDVRWSSAALSVWAKTNTRGEAGADPSAWLPLVQHLTDASGVAGELWDHWLPASVRRVISAGLPDGDADGRTLVCWLAGIHDIGKAAPAFAIKARHLPEYGFLLERMHEHGLSCRGVAKPFQPHCRLGHAIARDWLVTRFGFTIAAANTWVSPVGAHHGLPPTPGQLDILEGTPGMGRASHSWRQVQDEILEGMTQLTGAADRLEHWRLAHLGMQSQVLASGVVIVADWLASDAHRFPYDRIDEPHARLHKADLGASLLGPWRHPAVIDVLATRLQSRFPWLREPNEVQTAFADAAEQMTEPGLLLLEAPMGSGKTEAALLAAEVLAQKFGSGGVFVALPTMATSDAMFDRVSDWVERVPSDGPNTTYLAHGRARLNERFAGLPRLDVTQVNAHEEGDPASVVTSWLYGRRRGVLANMVVGTIDQVLVAALSTRHLSLRHLALAGKVLIIDEVHAADTYMQVYLLRALEWLAAYQVPVILLSATLPPTHRQELCRAYERGRASRDLATPAPGVGRSYRVRRVGQSNTVATPVASPARSEIAGYPLVTTVTGQTRSQAVQWSGRRVGVEVASLPDELETLVDAVGSLVSDGACVVVVRNTVARAQDAYRELTTRLGQDHVTLVHSRFTASDRAIREKRIVGQLGPPRDDTTRPRGLIVVGTQVLEQSLDIDADVLFTDLAPIDLVLQRIGRLHRHARGAGESDRPASCRRPRVYLTGVTDWAAMPVKPVAASIGVYGLAPLLRSALVLDPYLSTTRGDRQLLSIPEDIARLVRDGYGTPLEAPVGWSEALAVATEEEQRKAEETRHRAETFRIDGFTSSSSMVGWVRAPSTEPEVDDRVAGRAQVRDGEDNLEVILVQRDAAGEIRLLPGLAPHQGRSLGFPAYPPERHLAFAAATSTLRLPSALTPPYRIDGVIGQLEAQARDFEGWSQSPWLKGQLVLCLDSELTAELDGWHLSYDVRTGLSATPPSRPRPTPTRAKE